MIECIGCDPKWLNEFNEMELKELIIPNGVTEIKKQDIERFNMITKISLPSTLCISDEIENSTELQESIEKSICIFCQKKKY